MKRILITGVHSYIGNSFQAWLDQWPDDYQVTKISCRGEEWKNKDFSQFDVVFNVVGIAHNSSDPKLKNLYYEINRDLTVQIAKKAKDDGVRQFIHMSSIIVYGSSYEFITADTKPDPDNFYGDSKLQGDLGIEDLIDEQFYVTLVRPPMVYGKNSKGNFPLLVKFSQISPVFPKIENKRSMIYIENLCECIRLIIDDGYCGTVYPQNSEYVNTSNLVKTIGSEMFGRKIHLTRGFNWIFYILRRTSLIKKVFGNLVYDKKLSLFHRGDYQIFGLEESISRSKN